MSRFVFQPCPDCPLKKNLGDKIERLDQKLKKQLPMVNAIATPPDDYYIEFSNGEKVIGKMTFRDKIEFTGNLTESAKKFVDVMIPYLLDRASNWKEIIKNLPNTSGKSVDVRSVKGTAQTTPGITQKDVDDMKDMERRLKGEK